MNVFTFLLKGKKQSKSAIIAALFLFGLTAMWGLNKGYEQLTLRQEIRVTSVNAVSTQTSTKKSIDSQAFMDPCTETYECLGKINLSVGLGCEASIGPDMLFVNPTGLPADTFLYVIKEPNGAIRDTNLFTSVDLGKIFKVSVSIKGCSNPPCWSDVLIEDKIRPVLTCASDVTITCSMNDTNVDPPTVTDNCILPTVSKVAVAYYPYPCNNPESADYLGYYIIKWKAVDAYGMDTTCDQTVKVVRTDFSGIIWPSPSVTLECQDVVGGVVTPAQGGLPYLNGSPLYPIMDACMAQLQYHDTLISADAFCTKLIRRDWELIQWTCGAPLIIKKSQLLKIVDTQAPVIAEIPDMTVFMTSGDCKQKIKLPLASAKDQCQKSLKYEVIYPGGVATTNGPTIELGVGIHLITYYISDLPCGNTASEEFTIVVIDKVAPIAICKPVNVIALTNSGVGFLTAQQVGSSSYDGCGDPVTLKIRRMELGCQNDTAWMDKVHYCCEDIGRDLMVAIKVTDINGNENFCMTSVIVQNKIIPDAIFPEDTTIKCSFVFDYSRLDSVFGAPMIIGTECQNAGSFRDTIIKNIGSCGTGTIERRWQLYFNGNVVKTGSQIITIVPDMFFNPDSIVWPMQEVYAELGKTDTSFTGSPKIPFVPCNMVGLNTTEDTLFFNNSGTCFKILRTWKVINWCGRDPIEVIAQFTQTIIVEDKVPPVITSPTTKIIVCSYENTCASSDEVVILKASATDNKTLVKDLIWFYEIDLFKNGSVDATGSGDSVSFTAPVGVHSVTFTVYDGCGSSAKTTYDFEVKNCKEPSPKCISLATKFMEVPPGGLDPMVEVCAIDFDAGSEDICTPADSLRFTFNMAYPVDSLIYIDHYFKGNGQLATEQEYLDGNAQRWDASRRTSCIILNCRNAPIAKLGMTIWDLDKNKGICEVTITLQGKCCADGIAPIITTSDTIRRIKNTAPNCTGPMKVTISATATDNIPDSLLKWTYMVDLGNDGSIDTTGFTNTAMIMFPVDTHKVTFIVSDTCRNRDTLMYLIIVYNDKGPKANCRVDTLSITLVDPDGVGPMGSMAFLNAKDLDNLSNLSADSCSTDSLIYTFDGAYPVTGLIGQVHYFTGNGVLSDSLTFVAGNAQKWLPGSKTSQLKFDCSDQGIKSITFTVWDPSKKSSSCSAMVNISGNCPCGDLVNPTISTSDSIRNFCILTNACDSLTVTLGASATDPGTPAGRLTWIYRLDYGNNGSIESTGMGTGGSILITPKAPIGMNKVTFIVSDTCNNKDTLMYVFKIKNCLPPVCATRSITITPLDPDGDGPMLAMAEVSADTLNNGSTDACTPANQLIFTFSGAYPKKDSLASMHFFKGNGLSASLAEFIAGTAQKWNPARRSSIIKITCPNAPSTLQMTVWDTDTLSSTCPANIIVNCSKSLCAFNDYTGYMVVTCHTREAAPSRTIGAIYNVRQNASAPSMTNWALTPIIPSNWKLDSIGQIFGVATDDSANVYLASSDIYLYPSIQPVGIPTGSIYKASPPSFRAVPLTTLANSGGNFNGIGNLVFDRKHKQLFASNLEDGIIYRINPVTGTVIDSYNPFSADNGANGIAPQAEQIWGIGINYEADSTKIYFARINGVNRQMYSLKLQVSGAFPAAASERLEISNLPGDEVRISDIAFTDNGLSMVWAERGGASKVSPAVAITQGSHTAIVAKYNFSGTWILDKTLKVGANVETEFQQGSPGVTGITFGENSAGGVDFGFKQVGADSFAINAGLIWASGNWLHKGTSFTNASGDSLFYGAQAIPFDSIGNVRKDIVVDYNNDGTSFIDKGLIGDLELFRCKLSAPPVNLVADIGGEVFTQKDQMVEGVQMTIQGINASETATDTKGKYGLSALSKGSEYLVKPTKDDDHKNGLNVIDLLHLQRHILGIKRLENPYYMIAADVDNDQKISISDMVALRKVILGVNTRFDKNTSWRFLDNNFQFADVNNPWSNPLKESYYIENLQENMLIDFKAIKVGDLDGNVIANTAAVKNRSAQEANLTIDNVTFEVDETIEVPVYYNKTNLDALQLSLQFGSLEVLDIEVAQLAIDLSNAYIDQNKVLHLVHVEARGKLIDDSKPIFILKLKANKKGNLSDEMRIGEESMTFDQVIGESQLRLDIRNGSVESKMVVHQNYPNPWSNATVIDYDLPNSGDVIFTVRDLSGKLLQRKTMVGQKGSNRIQVESDLLTSDGIYFYSLQYGSEIQNRRMIFILK